MAQPTNWAELYRSLPALCPKYDTPAPIASPAAAPAPAMTTAQQQVVKKTLETPQPTECEAEESRRFTQRHAKKLAESIFDLLVKLVAESTELQLLFGINLKEDGGKLDLQMVIIHMYDTVDANPVDVEDRKDFVVLEAKFNPEIRKKLAPFYRDLQHFCKSFNVDLSKGQSLAPIIVDLLQKEFEEQLRRYQEEHPSLSKKMRNNAKNSITMAWMAVEMLSTLGVLDVVSAPLCAVGGTAAATGLKYGFQLFKYIKQAL